MRDGAAVALDDSGATVDVAVIADGLGLDVGVARRMIRQGKLTTRFEKGVGPDEGRMRLTFRIAGKRLQLVVDGNGAILHRFRTDFGRLPGR